MAFSTATKTSLGACLGGGGRETGRTAPTRQLAILSLCSSGGTAASSGYSRVTAATAGFARQATGVSVSGGRSRSRQGEVGASKGGHFRNGSGAQGRSWQGRFAATGRREGNAFARSASLRIGLCRGQAEGGRRA